MRIYLDSLDPFYSIDHEPKLKPERDYAGIGAMIFTFTVMSIVIGLSIYTAWQITYGFVDGNNNGKDDVQEWLDSIHSNETPENQQERYNDCLYFDGIWNGSSCRMKVE